MIIIGRIPAGFRPRDGFSRLVARRIDHADESGEHEVAFDALVDVIVRQVLVGGEISVRNAQRAQRPGGEFVVRLDNLQPADAAQRS